MSAEASARWFWLFRMTNARKRLADACSKALKEIDRHEMCDCDEHDCVACPFSRGSWDCWLNDLSDVVRWMGEDT